jgi:hypothetical protein
MRIKIFDLVGSFAEDKDTAASLRKEYFADIGKRTGVRARLHGRDSDNTIFYSCSYIRSLEAKS